MDLKDSGEDPKDVFDLSVMLGEGSYGAVWLGVHKTSKREVAIKIIPVAESLQDLQKEIQIEVEVKNQKESQTPGKKGKARSGRNATDS